MTTSRPNNSPTVLTLCAETAVDLMKPNPVSIRDNATIAEAISLLTDKGFSAAPVIDEAGYPVGVLSQSDIIIHQGEQIKQLTSVSGTTVAKVSEGQLSKVTDSLVKDIMTPAVFSVTGETPASQVVGHFLALNVHRLFVVDKSGILIGVITTLDVLKNLQ